MRHTPVLLYIVVSLFLAVLLDIWLIRFLHKQRRSGRIRLLKSRISQVSRNIFSLIRRFVGRIWTFFRVYPGIFLFIGIALIISSYQTSIIMQSRWQSILLLASGTLAVGLSSRKKHGFGFPVSIDSCSNNSQAHKFHKWQLLGIISSLFLVILTIHFSGFSPKMENPALAIGTWLLGMGIFIFTGSTKFHKISITKPTLISFLIIILVAFFIRLYHSINLPIILSGDEASFGLSAVEFLEGKRDNIFVSGWFSFPTFFSFIQSLPVYLLGNTTLALRISSIIVGSLTVGAVFLFTQQLFGFDAGLYAAIFMSAFHYHNNFSRLGLNNILDGLMYVLVLGSLWYGWEKESRNAFILAGISLGISQYFYVSSRMLFVIIPIWIIAVAFRDQEKLKRLVPGLLLMILGTIVTFLPLCWYFINYPNEYLAPLQRSTILGNWMTHQVQQTGMSSWEIMIKQIGFSFRGFTHIPLQHWYHPNTPILRLYPAVLFFVGLGFMIRHWRDSRNLLIGLWIVSIGLSGALSESTPAAQRYVAVAPALAVMIGFGLAEVKNILSICLPRISKAVAVLAMVSIVGLSADEIRFYFLEYAPHNDFGGDSGMVAQRLANYLQTKSDDYEVLFFGSPHMSYRSISSLPFLAAHIKMSDITEPWTNRTSIETSSNHLIFVLLPNHAEDRSQIMADYPCGSLITETIREGNILYWLYEVDLAECRRNPG